jgi:DNA repair protein RadA/Sms
LGNRPTPITQVRSEDFGRIKVPGEEFNRVLGGGIVLGSLVLIGGEPGIGKCVTGDTRVLDPESGRYMPITEWARNAKPVLAVDEVTLKLSPQQGVTFIDQGMKQIVEVTTRLGRKLRCTLTHPLLTVEGWKPASELEPGSRIAAPRALPYFGNRPMRDAEVKLIAYILSDGSASDSINVTTCLPEVEADLQVIAEAFGLRLVRYPKPGSKAAQYRFVNSNAQRRARRRVIADRLVAAQATAGITGMRWAREANVSYAMLRTWQRGTSAPSREEVQRLASAIGVEVQDLASDSIDLARATTPVMRVLDEMGLRKARARTKQVPTQVFELPREQLALFLKVLFSCDGSVYVNARGSAGVCYSTISRRLAEDVQHLLLRFGLVATLHSKKQRVNGEPYTAYEVVLLSVSEVKKFLSEIGIMGRVEARSRIEALQASDAPSTHRDTIPTGPLFWEHLKTALGRADFAKASRRAGTHIKFRRVERPLCRATVSKLAAAFPEPYLDALAEGDVYWDEISSIVPAGEERVYDLSVPEKANFVANDLIIHNSTALLQLASELALWGDKPVLYVSGEESPQQIKLRASRLDLNPERLLLLSETDLEPVLAQIDALQPGLVIVDSIQTMFMPELTSAAGSVSQVRECTARLMRLAKLRNIPMFLVGHVTKEGAIAGPRVLEHMVDVVLYLEGDRFHQYRLLRGVKNRFGSTNEVGVFEMGSEGMTEITNPSAAFLAERTQGAPGTSIAVTLEGTRPILVEVQALTSSTSFGLPRRTANGIDLNRLLLLTAVLTKRVGMGLSNQDIYINLVGGLKVNEPAIDLAVATAVASSFRDVPVSPELVLVGEVGLSGELRSVGQLERRLSEAAKLGFTRAIYPPTARKPHLPNGLQGLSVATLQEAIEAALTK